MSSQVVPRSNRLSSVIWGFVAGAFVLAGCAMETAPQVDPLAIGPDVEAIGVVSEESGRVISASGGLDAWSKAKKIDFECVATFYQEDGTFYLTEQRYEFFPWSSSVRISGREPSGEYTWQLQQAPRAPGGGRFGVLQGLSEYEGLGVGADKGCVAEGILSLVTAPVRLLDKGVEFRWSNETVNLGGQWYKPIKRVVNADAPDSAGLRDAGFYQSRSTERVDMVLLACGGSRGVLIVRGYDYRLLGRGGIMIPSKIEVFNADATGRVRHRIIQLDVK